MSNTRFARLLLSLSRTEQVNPFQVLPWTIRETRADTCKRINTLQDRIKVKAVIDFLEFLPLIPLGDIQVFSNRLKSEFTDGATSYGAVTYQYGLQTDRKSKSLGLHVEVFDAEATGALEGARSALTSPGAKLATDL